MDTNSKIFLRMFFGIVFIVVAISFYKYFILKDYYILYQQECDPKTEKCFVSKDNNETSYYKNIKRKANSSVLLSENNENLSTCIAGEDCSVIYCDSSDEEEGSECINTQTNQKEKENSNDNGAENINNGDDDSSIDQNI